MMLELRANAEKCEGFMPIEARTKREKVVAGDPQRTENKQREMRLSPFAMLPPMEGVKAPLSEAIQAAYEAHMEREGLDPSQDADGGHTEAEGA